MKVTRLLASPQEETVDETAMITVGYDGHWVYNVEPEVVDRRSIYKNFDTPLSETERNVCKLRDRPEDWDGYGAPRPKPDSIRHAYLWVESLYRDLRAELWIKPHVSSDEDGDVTFEWWNGRKKLTVYISPETAEYVTVERLDGSSNMEDGSIDTPEDRRMLWRWFIS